MTGSSGDPRRVTFSFCAFRFWLRAGGSLFFPEGKSGNIVRGAFGTIFRKLACVPECRDARTCELRETCPYARIFEPSALEGPSGLADPPDPALAYFVLTFAQLAHEGLGPGRGGRNWRGWSNSERIGGRRRRHSAGGRFWCRARCRRWS